MPPPLVLALASSLRRIMDTGLEKWIDARAALARGCREGLRDLGFAPVPQPGVESNMVVAFWAEDAPAIQRHVLVQGIQISGGLAPLAGRTLRIGLMGRTATEAMVGRVLEAIAKVPATDRARMIGYVVALNGKVATVDMFNSPRLFRKLEDKLVKSYLTESIDVPAGKHVTAPTTAETMSEPVEAMTCAAKVEAFMPWSMTVTR
jgi:hypothetical protein